MYKSKCPFCEEVDSYISQLPNGWGHGTCNKCGQGALSCPNAQGHQGHQGPKGEVGRNEN